MWKNCTCWHLSVSFGHLQRPNSVSRVRLWVMHLCNGTSDVYDKSHLSQHMDNIHFVAAVEKWKICLIQVYYYVSFIFGKIKSRYYFHSVPRVYYALFIQHGLWEENCQSVNIPLSKICIINNVNCLYPQTITYFEHSWFLMYKQTSLSTNTSFSRKIM